MLLKAFFVLLTQTFGILTATVFPALPPTMEIYFGYLVNYINQGMAFIAVFLDIPYVSALFGWWIQLGTIILAIELFIWIWSVITGNVYSVYHTENTSFDYEGRVRPGNPNVTAVTVRDPSQYPSSSSSGSRYPTKYR